MSTVRLVDFDELFANSQGKIIPTRQELMKKTTVAEILKELFLDETDMSFVARCPNGCLVGGYFDGVTCPKCGELVTTKSSQDVAYSLWVEMPDFAPPVLHPRAYTILSNYFKLHRLNLFDLLMSDPDNKLPSELAAWYIPGWRNFYEQFDRLMTFLLDESSFVKTSAKQRDLPLIKEFIRVNRDQMFITKFPILDSTLHLITAMGDIRCIDPSAQFIVKLIVDLSVAQYQYDHSPKSQTYINKVLSEIYATYHEYLDSVMMSKLVGTEPKNGYIRRNGMGVRCHWSCRAVISPIVKPHMGDELHMPWTATVKCMTLEIINLLVNRKGKSLSDALNQVTAAISSYDEEIHDILNTLIQECPYKGLPILLDRNPSLILGSCQLMFVTEVLPHDSVICISPMCITASNADFDGDQLNGWWIKEMGAVPAYMNMHPRMTMFDKRSPGIGNFVKVSDQAEVATQAWLNSGKFGK